MLNKIFAIFEMLENGSIVNISYDGMFYSFQQILIDGKNWIISNVLGMINQYDLFQFLSDIDFSFC